MAADRNVADLEARLDEVLAGMPDPWRTDQVDRYEAELARVFEVEHAVAVSSGTAALHGALCAVGIGPGDEVLVPAVSVVMSVVPILYVGAVPVFVDCGPDGFGLDLDDLQAKITSRTRAVLPVHLWGRTGDVAPLIVLASERKLWVVEDACQAIGSRVDGQLAGTLGDLGCFSTKDGKILWSGEGGFIITDDGDLAQRCRALRSHWLSPPPGEPPLSRVGYNYRLAEPLAALARANLGRFDALLHRRREQAQLLLRLVADVPGLVALDEERWQEHNGHAPLVRVDLPRPREFCAHLASLGVTNSVGSYRLVAADQRPLFSSYVQRSCPRAAACIDRTLAVELTERHTDGRIRELATIIRREAARWATR